MQAKLLIAFENIVSETRFDRNSELPETRAACQVPPKLPAMRGEKEIFIVRTVYLVV